MADAQAVMAVDEVQAAIHSATERGVPFARIEERIEALGFEEEMTAALWLYAWSLQERRKQRRMASQALRWARARERGVAASSN